MSDDHCVPNTNNAHIDTSGFIEDLKHRVEMELFTGTTEDFASSQTARRNEIYQFIYDSALSKSSSVPNQPPDDAIICRFLSPEKFLWVIDQKSILFSSPRNFDDNLDSALHEDFNDAVLQFLPEILAQYSCNCNSQIACEEWISYERRRRDDWLISCWTHITDHKDDKLIWYKYATGPVGVGITTRYGKLRDAFQHRIGDYSRYGKLASGFVNYKPQVSKLLPFNKRNGFRGEQEVRFAIHGFEYQLPVMAPLSDRFFEMFNLRFSDDAPQHHKAALENLWIGAGGNADGINEG